MHWHEFVFSNKRNIRVLRHTIFWLCWWLYFLLCYHLYNQPLNFKTIKPYYTTLGLHLPLKTLLLVLLYAAASLPLIYFTLPRLVRGKWLTAVASVLLVGGFLFSASWFLYWTLFPWINTLFGEHKMNPIGTQFWPPVALGLLNFTKVLAAVIIIKYSKYWWLKQRESERIEKEKIKAELQLLKAQINPGFLFTALNNIYTSSMAASPHTSDLLLKLSDLLSYMLYECDEPIVSLKKEIEVMKEYMALEKLRLDNSFEMEVNVVGDINGKMIAPFLLLPFIENSFKQSSKADENAWINMDIGMEKEFFHLKLANGMLPNGNGLQEVSSTGLANVQKRLILLYPQRHELKITREEEMLIVHLKIQLNDAASPVTGKGEYLVGTPAY